MPQVADQAKVQARQVYGQAKQELDQQVQSQHQRAAGGLNALADELSALAHGTGDQQDVAHDLAQQGQRPRSRSRPVARGPSAS